MSEDYEDWFCREASNFFGTVSSQEVAAIFFISYQCHRSGLGVKWASYESNGKSHKT